MVTGVIKFKDACSLEEKCFRFKNKTKLKKKKKSCDKPRQCVEKQRNYSADQGPYSQGYGLSSGHIQL